ncbi:unnamed protein product [Prunus armeniaca]
MRKEMWTSIRPDLWQRGTLKEEHKGYRLKKALYGLKQAPRAWYNRIEAYFAKEGFEKCLCEHTLFIKSGGKGKLLIVSLYVDDLIFTGNDEDMFKSFKESMKKEFDMSDLGRMKYFLGVKVVQNLDGIFICQRMYAKEVLERFGMERSNPVNNPIVPGCKLSKSGSGAVNVDATEYKQLIGIGLISRYMEKPTEMHLQAAKDTKTHLHVLRSCECGVYFSVGFLVTSLYKAIALAIQ